jgi:uncharacterized repeat protein (TIGR03803 family)
MTRFDSWTKTCAVLVLCMATAMVSHAETTFKTLLNFDGTNGSYPTASLVQGPNGNLYGVTSSGGKNNGGTVFEITTEGKLTTLYNFCSETNCTDGEFPNASLLLATNGNFYGTTEYGGFKDCAVTTSGCGTIFEITPAGKLTTLYTFCVNGGDNCSDGANPKAPLIQGTNGDFFGTTFFGGNANDAGTLFEITPKGKLTTRYTFCSEGGENCSDGANPEGAVVMDAAGDVYLATSAGGEKSGNASEGSNPCDGVLAKVVPEEDVYRLFLFFIFCAPIEGSAPEGGLDSWVPLVASLASSTAIPDTEENLLLYGPTSGGGTHLSGVVFSITSAKKYSDIYNFCSKKNCADGAYPNAVIEGTDGNLFGTTTGGNGNSNCPNLKGCGTAFELTTKGVLTTLHSFDKTDGEYPSASLVQATNGTFYGTTTDGGANSDGTVFSISVGLGPFVETVPTAGKVGATVIILGTDLSEATSVTFNGTAAEFKVVSATEITTTVPSGATSGTVEVTTPSGTLKSWPFQVL